MRSGTGRESQYPVACRRVWHRSWLIRGDCKTCREFEKTCKGCKQRYLDGSRDLSRAKCRMKKCCLTKGRITCVDCAEYESCETAHAFLNHPGYKYSKYKQALEFIRAHDYAAFLKAAEHWKNAYGKYPEQDPEISNSAR